MKLLVNELQPQTYQEITPTKNVNVEAIRPHLYKHNFPAGNVLIEIHDTNGDLVAASETLAIADISSENFYHGYIRFYINASLQAGVTYRVVIKAQGGYSFSEAAYIGVCKAFDFSTYATTYSPNIGVNAPLDLQVWVRK